MTASTLQHDRSAEKWTCYSRSVWTVVPFINFEEQKIKEAYLTLSHVISRSKTEGVRSGTLELCAFYLISGDSFSLRVIPPIKHQEDARLVVLKL